MIALKSVLVPTDFSDASEAALLYAKAFARAFGASLHVLHVVQEPFSQPWAVEAHGFALATMQEDWMREAKGRVQTILTPDERSTYKAQLMTVLGHPVVEILEYAGSNAIDLIVMGTHGRGPLGHMLMGSVAERIVRKAPCPVLTVRHLARDFVVPDYP
jgi:nucleotide-binding universal stress UspA family protein